MTSHFADKSGKVVVVDPSGPVRQLLSDVVKAMGFTEVQGCASIRDALDFLEVEVASWVVCPLMSDAPVNGLQLLKACTVHPALRKVRISLLIEESEEYVLMKAFELGLLSYHKKPFTKDTLGEEIARLRDRLEKDDFNETKTSARYLRDHLKKADKKPLWLELEKNLISIFPGNTDLMVQYAKALHANGDEKKARATLRQAHLIDTEGRAAIDKLAVELFGEEGLAKGGAEESTNILNLKNVAIVDSDDSVRQSITDILKSLGVEAVHAFSDGDEAFNWISKQPELDAIIHEWRIPKLTGPMLVQRIRQLGHLSVPLIVHSSLIKADDIPLIREMGVAGHIPKPLVRDKFTSAFVATIQQDRTPTDLQSLERKIRQLLATGNAVEAKKFQEKMNKDPAVGEGHKLKIAAEFAFHEDDFTSARDKGIEALKKSGDSLMLLNLLGKIFMKLHDFDASLRCFKKAQELSPKNIERLCNIAEVQTELGDDKAAENSLDQASALDKDNAAIKTTKADKAIKSGDIQVARSLMNEMESVSNYVAYLNNKAVAHARCGFPDEAIELYRKTLNVIAEDRADLVPIVRYNFALARIRNSELDVASELLGKVAQASGSKVQKKAASLKQRIDKAITAGEAFSLPVDNAKAPDPTPSGSKDQGAKDSGQKLENAKQEAVGSDHMSLLAAVDANRGDICCFKVFTAAADNAAKIDDLLSDMPRYNHRGAIARAEGLGAERLMKSAS